MWHPRVEAKKKKEKKEQSNISTHLSKGHSSISLLVCSDTLQTMLPHFREMFSSLFYEIVSKFHLFLNFKRLIKKNKKKTVTCKYYGALYPPSVSCIYLLSFFYKTFADICSSDVWGHV